MNYFHTGFNPFGNKSISIGFSCNNCGSQIKSDNIGIPEPDYMADTAHDSVNDVKEIEYCPSCDKEFELGIYVTYAGGDVIIPEIPEEYPVSISLEPELYYEEQLEAIVSNTQFYKTFLAEMENLKKLSQLTLTDKSMEKTLFRQIFIGVITTMETYLSDSFINITLNVITYKRKFVETFHEFKDKSIALKDLYDVYERIEDTCKKELIGVIYHNLPKVKGMFKDTLNVDLGDISFAYKSVITRHDLVHRNGRNKENIEIEISKEKLNELIEKILLFVTKIDKNLKTETSKLGVISF